MRRVGNLIRNQHLLAIQPKSSVPKTTDSRHKLVYSPNLLLKRQEPNDLHQLWVSDITYIPLVGGEFCYLPLWIPPGRGPGGSRIGGTQSGFYDSLADSGAFSSG